MLIERDVCEDTDMVKRFCSNWDSSAYSKTSRIGGTPRAGTATFISGKQDMTESQFDQNTFTPTIWTNTCNWAKRHNSIIRPY